MELLYIWKFEKMINFQATEERQDMEQMGII
jgi:hypothetical protein